MPLHQSVSQWWPHSTGFFSYVLSAWSFVSRCLYREPYNVTREKSTRSDRRKFLHMFGLPFKYMQNKLENAASMTMKPAITIFLSSLVFLLVLYLSLPTFQFRGRKNVCGAKSGWRLVANRYHSQNHRIYREKSKTRNGARYAEVWIGKLRLNTTRRAALIGRKHLNVRRVVLLKSSV